MDPRCQSFFFLSKDDRNIPQLLGDKTLRLHVCRCRVIVTFLTKFAEGEDVGKVGRNDELLI